MGKIVAETYPCYVCTVETDCNSEGATWTVRGGENVLFCPTCAETERLLIKTRAAVGRDAYLRKKLEMRQEMDWTE
jgi:hypothetical protein